METACSGLISLECEGRDVDPGSVPLLPHVWLHVTEWWRISWWIWCDLVESVCLMFFPFSAGTTRFCDHSLVKGRFPFEEMVRSGQMRCFEILLCQVSICRTWQHATQSGPQHTSSDMHNMQQVGHTDTALVLKARLPCLLYLKCFTFYGSELLECRLGRATFY